MTLQIPKRLLTVAEYHKMMDADILKEGDRIELLNGEIIQMSPIKSKHAGHVNRIDSFFKQLLGKQAIVAVQNPVQLGDLSEPEPDIALLHYQADYYTEQHPQAKDVYILIEVSLSTEQLDRTVKLPLYATANIPEYWLVNLNNTTIEIYTSPNIEEKRYDKKKVVEKKDIVILELFGISFSVSELLF